MAFAFAAAPVVVIMRIAVFMTFFVLWGLLVMFAGLDFGFRLPHRHFQLGDGPGGRRCGIHRQCNQQQEESNHTATMTEHHWYVNQQSWKSGTELHGVSFSLAIRLNEISGLYRSGPQTPSQKKSAQESVFCLTGFPRTNNFSRMSVTHSKPDTQKRNDYAPRDGSGNRPDAGTSFDGQTRKPEMERPFRIVSGDYFAAYKGKFLKTRKIPKQPDLSDRIQFSAWKQFCGWLKFHKPPFEEASQVPRPCDIKKP